ncbi:hypothetical protein LCD52_22965 [Rossellomorea vietnamensis]|uniref:hypothetical protein n=1 Tax=Rossellomorea vietnamensis TaxID=218284 RepID=UPI001CCCC907|nr:hypothetical protein [Rossellomorea vietnamensis]MCA0151571.1 hypothetical protein [Rossellomorea vietnamensis]
MKKRLLTFATASFILMGAFGAVQATTQFAELPPVYSPSSTQVAVELPPVYSRSSSETAAELPPVYAKKELPPVY